MRDALIVMHAREIEPCMAAFHELDIPKIWMTGYTERGIANIAFTEALKHDFDWFWVASDDIIIRQPALDAVRRIRDTGDHAVVTGYSQGSHTDWTVNLTSEPLRPGPLETAYVFRQYSECVSHPDPVIPTWFTGMTMTGMSKHMWYRFPFDCFSDPGYASDFHISTRLQEAGVPIVAAREGFAYHWRHNRIWGDERDGTCTLLGQRSVTIEYPKRQPLAVAA